MSVRIVLDPEAQSEFDDGYDHYQLARRGLGETFADAVEAVLYQIAVMPRMHQVVFRDVRRAVVRGFPFCLYYREEGGLVRVISVFHTSRDPSVWKDRA